MTRRAITYRLRRAWRDETGAAAFEFAIVASLLLFLFFVLLDFGRMTYSQVMAEQAVHLAARTAVVRPAACSGVPDFHARGGISPAPRFGTACSAGAGTCVNVGTITCTGSAANSTATEIWTTVQPWLPPGT
ncbi:pilus assembly protein, partial [Escherichia coli]|nr:pilus assembly protein [Escherichia coli]